MERNENGYSSYNLAPDSARGGRCNGGCQQGGQRAGDDGRNGNCRANGNGCHGNGGNGISGGNGYANGNGGISGNDVGGSHNHSCHGGMPDGFGAMNGVSGRLAMAYVPMQCWRMLYSPDHGLMRGTLFEELDLPLEECTNE